MLALDWEIQQEFCTWKPLEDVFETGDRRESKWRMMALLYEGDFRTPSQRTLSLASMLAPVSKRSFTMP